MVDQSEDLKDLTPFWRIGDIVEPDVRQTNVPKLSDGFDLDWYVLTTSPLCERATARRIKRLFGGVEVETGAGVTEMISDCVTTHVPIFRRHVRRRGSRYILEQVLLPRYLFIGFVPTTPIGPPPWLDIFGVQGVQGVLGFDGRPWKVEATLVGDLISRSVRGVFDHDPPAAVQRGMRVVASSGTLRSFEGDVVNINKASNTAQVLFELINDRVPVTMRLDDLVSVSYSSQRMIG